MRHFLAVAALAVFSAQAQAICAAPRFSEPGALSPKDDRLLLVVHASATYDARYATKPGVDEAVRYAKQERIPVAYLQDDSGDQYYFAADCEPDYRFFSAGGELSVNLSHIRHLYVAGGHLEACLSTALNEVLYQWGQAEAVNRRITYFMDAVYSNGKSIDPADPFYEDVDRFLGIVSYGRPSGEHWPKLTLLETIGIVHRKDSEYQYLQNILPNWHRSLPLSYRVELSLNGRPTRNLRPVRDLHRPRLSFEFVDSAINNGLAGCPDGSQEDSCRP